jgi:NAD(P)-dependent dehydrogenase (short-subunit alcohol dehydrogenase family)
VSDRSVVVFGGSSGIGLATALQLSRRGDRITLVARDADSLHAAEKQCRDAGATDLLTVAGDVRNAGQVRNAVGTVLAAHGGIDAAVYSAAVMAYGRIDELPEDTFTAVVESAVLGTFNVAQAVVPEFRRTGRGTFVIVNSLLGSVTVPTMGAYSVSKWGQRALARTLQQELRDRPDVNVCIVTPGSTNTPIYYQAANYLDRIARPPFPVQQPEHTAARIAGLLDSPKRVVSFPVGRTNPLITLGFRALPRFTTGWSAHCSGSRP